MSSLIERLAGRVSLTEVSAPVPGKRAAAVAVVLHADRVLLMQRAVRTGDPWSGHISLPGGGYHADDRDMLATAIRETREELGIDLAGTRLLGNLAPLHPRTSGPEGIEVTPYVFSTEVAVEPQCGPEATSAFWLPIELVAAGSLDGTYTYEVSGGFGMAFPCWTYNGHVIWGLTLRIISDLLVRSREP